MALWSLPVARRFSNASHRRFLIYGWMFLVRSKRHMIKLLSKAAGEFYSSLLMLSSSKLLDCSSSPIRRFWDQDEPPSSYYQETEGTPEFDRRKAVSLLSLTPSDSSPISCSYSNATLSVRHYLANSSPPVYKRRKLSLEGHKRSKRYISIKLIPLSYNRFGAI
jgi:hypothetical protein